ncbi:MAG: hypothetical protein NZR01_10700 [Bryobacteraceae bacterium]|nr:hypothetical protein [Bryobacteraceae bacterium]
MKHFLAVLLCLAAASAAAAGQEAKKEAGRKDSGRPSAAAPAVTVPAGAEKLGEGKWRARDAQGRAWIYRRTPFGMVRYEEKAGGESPAPETNYIRVREASGSRVVFERQTPFGLRTWSRSPEELDEDERRALEQWRASQKKQD